MEVNDSYWSSVSYGVFLVSVQIQGDFIRSWVW